MPRNRVTDGVGLHRLVEPAFGAHASPCGFDLLDALALIHDEPRPISHVFAEQGRQLDGRAVFLGLLAAVGGLALLVAIQVEWVLINALAG